MPDSAQKVLQELTAAGLVSADQATDFDAELKTGAEALLARLVSDGHITAYQSDKFLNGQASDIYFGDYVVLEKLGQGGMGTVLLAKHRRMDRKVAIKILPVTALDSEAAVAAILPGSQSCGAVDASQHRACLRCGRASWFSLPCDGIRARS